MTGRINHPSFARRANHGELGKVALGSPSQSSQTVRSSGQTRQTQPQGKFKEVATDQNSCPSRFIGQRPVQYFPFVPSKNVKSNLLWSIQDSAQQLFLSVVSAGYRSLQSRASCALLPGRLGRVLRLALAGSRRVLGSSPLRRLSSNKEPDLSVGFFVFVRRRGLEPPYLTALAPQASVSTNFTIAAGRSGRFGPPFV